MTYASLTSDISRAPITLIKMTLDACDNVYGVPPCTASGAAGTECYNTFPTCQDKPNYVKTTKVYTFSSARGAEIEARPYLSNIRWMPTEIKPGKITVKGRITMSLDDEPDTDRGIDPYVDTRSSVQGTFWKKLLARNPNFKGRVIEIYQGYDGLDVGDYELRWAGLIDSITLDDAEVKIEVADELIALDKIEIPPKLDIELPTSISDSATSITTSDSNDLPTAGYAKIEDECISWTSKNDTTNIVSGVTRGALGTTATAHDDGTRFDLCVFYDAANPFDIMEGMLTNSVDIEVDNPPGAGLASSRVDSASFAAAKEFPGDEPNFSTLLFKPAKISKLLFEIADLCDCSVWMNEEQKITIRRNNIPNEGGRTYATITDESNIITAAADLNEGSRKTRVAIYWDREIFGDETKTEDYNAVNIAIDVSAESANEYNGIEEYKIASRWLRKTWGAYTTEEIINRFVSNLSSRLLVNRRDAQPIINFDVELKDEGIQSGDYVKISTDELLNVDGTDLNSATFSIWKRDHRDEIVRFASVGVRSNKIGIIAPDAIPSFTSATTAQKEYGFISDNDGLMSDGSPGYRIY